MHLPCQNRWSPHSLLDSFLSMTISYPHCCYCHSYCALAFPLRTHSALPGWMYFWSTFWTWQTSICPLPAADLSKQLLARLPKLIRLESHIPLADPLLDLFSMALRSIWFGGKRRLCPWAFTSSSRTHFLCLGIWTFILQFRPQQVTTERYLFFSTHFSTSSFFMETVDSSH